MGEHLAGLHKQAALLGGYRGELCLGMEPVEVADLGRHMDILSGAIDFLITLCKSHAHRMRFAFCGQHTALVCDLDGGLHGVHGAATATFWTAVN